MNLKRIFFGLFMTVFTLCGCVSTVKLDAGNQLVLRTKTEIDAPDEFQIHCRQWSMLIMTAVKESTG